MAAAKDTATAPVIDITKHGYFKLLGKGQLPQQPVVVRAKFVSKLAEKKIKEVRRQGCCCWPGVAGGGWWVIAPRRGIWQVGQASAGRGRRRLPRRACCGRK